MRYYVFRVGVRPFDRLAACDSLEDAFDVVKKAWDGMTAMEQDDCDLSIYSVEYRTDAYRYRCLSECVLSPGKIKAIFSKRYDHVNVGGKIYGLDKYPELLKLMLIQGIPCDRQGKPI